MDRSSIAVAVAAGLAAYGGARALSSAAARRRSLATLGVSDVAKKRQWLILVRHGDRHDYANPSWKTTVEAMGGRPRDPPLSELGRRQAAAFGAAAAAALAARGGSVEVYSSPYLRCLQTLEPLADAVDATLTIEPGLAEIQHATKNVAAFQERFAYFPRLEAGAADRTAGVEGWPVEYMGRIARFAKALGARADALLDSPGPSTVVLGSHAASVALVSAVLGDELTVDAKMAPCGAYVLARDAAGEPWTLLRSGASNAPYVTENAATTFPWGYKAEYLDAWRAARGGASYPAGADV